MKQLKKAEAERKRMMTKRVKLIITAISANDPEIAKLIIEKTDLSYRDNRSSLEPLDAAIAQGNDELVAALLTNGASIHHSCHPSGSSMVRALENNCVNIAQMLYDKGATLPSYLIYYAGNFTPITLEWVLKHGFDPNTLSPSGNSTLLYTATAWRQPLHVSVIKLHMLAKYGYDMLTIDDFLRRLVENAENELVKLSKEHRVMQLRHLMYKSTFGRLPKEVFRVVESFLYS